MYFGQVVTAYGKSFIQVIEQGLTIAGYAYFAPSIIKTYGYSGMSLSHHLPDRSLILPAIKTQLYSIPPWAAAFGFSMLVAWLSDKLRHRYLFTLIPMLVAMAGYGILLNIHGESSKNTQYGALFLVTSGCYSAMPVLICWYTMNLGGHRRRSIGSAWQIGFGNSKFLYFFILFFSSILFLVWVLTKKSAESSPPTLSWKKTLPSTDPATSSVYPSSASPPL